VTVTTPVGRSGAQPFTINLPAPGRADADERRAESRHPGATVAVTLTGTNFVVGATTVNVSGAGVTVNTVVVGSGTSLTANFVIDPAAAGCPRHGDGHAGGTSGAQTFTVNPPAADADQRRAESGPPGQYGGGHADGHQFRRRRAPRWPSPGARDGDHRHGGQRDVADRQLRGRCRPPRPVPAR
jgi:hypothetical protein